MDSKCLRPPLLFCDGTWCCNKPECSKLNNYQDNICYCGTRYDDCDFIYVPNLIYEIRYKNLWKRGYILIFLLLLILYKERLKERNYFQKDIKISFLPISFTI